MTGNGRMKVSALRGGPQRKSVQRVRWLSGYRGFGKPDTLIENLSNYLRQHRLTDTVYALRLEKRPRKGEFYFFLTFETEYPEQLPQDVQDCLADCSMLRSALGPCSEEQVTGFVGHEVKVKALGQCLTYRALRLEVSGDPFSYEAAPSQDTPLGEASEKLLWFLSAVGQGSWSTLQSACGALGVADSAHSLARTLSLLGHLEMSSDGERWSINPTQCVEINDESGESLYFQIGARIPASEGERQPQRNGPPRLVIQEAKEIISQPAETLAPLLPNLTEYREGLAIVGGVSSVQHQISQFDGLHFRPEPFTGTAGLYEVTAKTGRRMTLLYQAGEWRRGEWYGLRYLNLHAEGLLLPAQYDNTTGRLALPADQRPPLLYERALVLSSGLLPQWYGEWLVYNNIPLSVAQIVTEKLDLPLQEVARLEENHE